MLGDINRDLEPIEYELILCKPDKSQIGVLNAENISIDFRFPTTDELSFSIYYGENYYDLIKGDYLILLNEEKYFIIDNPEEVGNGIEVKNIHCYSLEYMLNKKNVRGYKFVSRKLYSLTDELDSDGFHLGVMNYVKTITSWKLDVNSFTNFTGIDLKYRSFDISEKSLFDFLINDVQKAYECIFLFDTLTKTISVKAIDDLQGNKGLYISEDNYIKSINNKIKNDEIKTRLYCYGNDISIAEINPTGVPYIENYTFYKTLEYMSQELIDALNAYEENLDFNSQIYADLLNDLSILSEELIVLNNDLTDSKTALVIIETNLDIAIKNNQSLTQLNIDLTNAENNISSKQLLVDSKKSEIDAKYVTISNYNNSIKITNYLNTDTLLEEFDNFIKETTWEDNNYVEEIDLLEAGKKKLLKLSTPALIFEIEVIDFLSVVECQHDWQKLVLGDIVSIEFSKFDVDIEVRLVGYTHNPSDNSLNLVFSNKDAIDDPFIYQIDLMNNAITSSTTLNMNKNVWDNKANSSAIDEIRKENIDATLKQILASKNQSQIIDKRGIWLKEIDDDGIVSPEQLRIINNSIVLTKDAFQTASTAISPNGINSGVLIGNSVIGVSGLFESLTVVDTEGQSIATIGMYGVDNKRGIQINSGSLEIVGGLPSSQIDPSFTNGFLNLSNTYNGVKIDSENGLQIQKTDGSTTLTNQIVLNATDGLKIQKNVGTYSSPIWTSTFYVDTSGNLSLTGSIVNNSDVLINASTKTIDFSKFTTKLGTISATNIDATNLHVNSANIDGTLTANYLVANASITSPNIIGGTITIGSSNSIFKADSNGIYLGNSSFSSAPFRVSPIGLLNASNAQVSGVISTIPDASNSYSYFTMNGNQITGYKGTDIVYSLTNRYMSPTLYYGSLNIYRMGSYGNNRLFSIDMTDLTTEISTSVNTPLEIRPNVSSFDGSSTYSANSQYVGIYGGMIIGSTYSYSSKFNPIQDGLMVQGKVAIGKTSANYSLDVVGDINLTGNLYKNGTLLSNIAVFA